MIKSWLCFFPFKTKTKKNNKTINSPLSKSMRRKCTTVVDFIHRLMQSNKEQGTFFGGGTWCPETIRPKTMCPETMCPKTIRPRDNVPRRQYAPRQSAPETICPRDNLPRRQPAPGDNMPRDNVPRRHHAPETIRPGFKIHYPYSTMLG